MIALDLARVVAPVAQRAGHGPVYDLEHSATHQLLVLDQRDVGLNSRRVAVHHERNRPGRCNDCDLGVAITMLTAELESFGPRALRLGMQVGRYAFARNFFAEFFVQPDHFKKRRAIAFKLGERPDARGDLGRASDTHARTSAT